MSPQVREKSGQRRGAEPWSPQRTALGSFAGAGRQSRPRLGAAVGFERGARLTPQLWAGRCGVPRVRSSLTLRHPQGDGLCPSALEFVPEGWWNCFHSSWGRPDRNLTIDQKGSCVRDPWARPQAGDRTSG